jgi:hypothetical protein
MPRSLINKIPTVTIPETIDGYRIHYNFIRDHSSIKKTPAEQAGIKLDLGSNKIEKLIKLTINQC